MKDICVTSVLIVGAGRMGSALLQRWANIDDVHLTAVEPEKELNAKAGTMCRAYQRMEDIPRNCRFDVIVIATKPQFVGHIAELCRSRLSEDGLIVSIAAGVGLDSIGAAAGTDQAIVRAMPNLPVLIGEGTVVCCASSTTLPNHLRICKRLFGSVGEVYIADESAFDAVTAVSGSGPAYLFKFMEELHAAALNVGLDPNFALTLIKQTVYGAAKMALEGEASLSALRTQVTSPGGTTEAGLAMLEREGTNLRGLLMAAVKSAFDRSKEIERQLSIAAHKS